MNETTTTQTLCECGDELTTGWTTCISCECNECGCSVSIHHCGHFDCGECAIRFKNWGYPL